MTRRFAVALSFPGEHRAFVRRLAEKLAATLTGDRVFYDRFFEAELSRPNLDTYLQQIYHSQSELIVVMLCSDYDKKEWCGLEFRAIRDLLKKRRDEEIMYVRLDDGDVQGVFGIDGYVDVKNRSASDIARIILDRLALLQSRDSVIPFPDDAATASSKDQALLLALEIAMKSGELRDSELAPSVVNTLGQESRLELTKPCDPKRLEVAIRVADSYFSPICSGVGTGDWQRDFPKMATPILVAFARSLKRSSDAQAVIVRLCNALAQRLRLTLVWPDTPDELNDLRNDLYRECLNARELESDAVLIVLQRLTIVGPG